MRENLGLQIALVLFAALTVLLAVSTYVYFQQYVGQRRLAEDRAQQLADASKREKLLAGEVQALQRAITERESVTTADALQIHRADVQRVRPSAAGTHMPGYRRLISHLLTAISEVVQREVRLQADLLAVREDLREQTDAHTEKIAGLQDSARQREHEFARRHAEDERHRAQMGERIDRLAEFSQQQSGELALARRNFDRMQSGLSEQVNNLRQQYAIVRTRWEATQADSFEVPDGRITFADAEARTVQIDLGRGDGLARGVVFHVFDPSSQGVTKTQQKATIEVTRITGAESAEARIIQDEIGDPILSGDLVFTPLWQAGVQREFCLLGILDINGDGRDDGEAVRNLIRRQNAVVTAEVDAQGQSRGEVTPDVRYVVIGRRPLMDAEGVPKDNYDKMLARAEELGIDQISVDKLLAYLNHRPAKVVRVDVQRRPAVRFRSRTRPSAY